VATSSFKPETTYTSVNVSDPTEVTIALLIEYSAKLTDKTEQLKSNRYRPYLWAYILFLLIYSALFFWTSQFHYVSIALISSVPVMILLLYLAFQRERLVGKEVASISSQLKRIVERASALEDHGGLSFGKRFELDIRMNDAESALRKASAIL
jgi:hypothetical protein